VVKVSRLGGNDKVVAVPLETEKNIPSQYHLDFWRRKFREQPILALFYNDQSFVEAQTNRTKTICLQKK